MINCLFFQNVVLILLFWLTFTSPPPPSQPGKKWKRDARVNIIFSSQFTRNPPETQPTCFAIYFLTLAFPPPFSLADTQFHSIFQLPPLNISTSDYLLLSFECMAVSFLSPHAFLSLNKRFRSRVESMWKCLARKAEEKLSLTRSHTNYTR